MINVVPAPTPVVIPVAGSDNVFPVHRILCIARNYAAHTIEMGGNPDRDPPNLFTKHPDAALFCPPPDGGTFPYPSSSSDVHHEIELVVALGKGGKDISAEHAYQHVWGYAVGLDMTCRDLQGAAKKAGMPWDTGKDFDHASPIGMVHPIAEAGHMTEGHIRLDVNGERRQDGNLDQMIWKIPEIIAETSRYFTLAPGDLIFTGTPSGIGPVQRGDVLEGHIQGLSSLRVTVA